MLSKLGVFAGIIALASCSPATPSSNQVDAQAEQQAAYDQALNTAPSETPANSEDTIEEIPQEEEFTRSEEAVPEEFASIGIRTQQEYADAKEILVSNGFAPGTGAPDACDSIGREACKPYPEIDSCSGTGMGYCEALFTKDGRSISVITFGPGGPVASID